MTEMLVKAYKTYVKPLLETNSQIWSPNLLKNIRRIEAVQRRFTKKLDGLHSFDYAERLSLLGLKRLEECIAYNVFLINTAIYRT